MRIFTAISNGRNSCLQENNYYLLNNVAMCKEISMKMTFCSVWNAFVENCNNRLISMQI